MYEKIFTIGNGVDFFYSDKPLEATVMRDQLQSDLATNILNYIIKNKVMVFSKSYCPHSKATKELLRQKNVEFEVVELDQVPEGA